MRTPTPRVSENVSPSTSRSRARTSVWRDSAPYASTASSPSAASTAARQSSRRSGVSATGASHGHARDAERRGAVADRHPLAVLAADALARLEVRRDGVDRGEDVDAPSDEIRPPDRRGELPVLDHVALADTEHEGAVRGVDLAAADRLHVQPARRVAEHV